MPTPSVGVVASPGIVSCQPQGHVELSWKLINPGPAEWPEGLVFRKADEDGAAEAVECVRCPAVPVGCTLDVTIIAVAPTAPGCTRLQYALTNDKGPVCRVAFEATLQVGPVAAQEDVVSAADEVQQKKECSRRLHPLMGLRPGNHNALCKLEKVEPHVPGEPAEVLCELEEWNMVDSVEPLPAVVAVFNSEKGKKGALAAVHFSVNGKPHTIKEGDVPIRESLAEFLRYRAGLTGTKVCCGEGGCGACTVVLKDTGGQVRLANSCLKPVWSMDTLEVTTTEGLGSTQKGFHKIQETIAKCDGSQCGMCTPGMVMAIYGYLHKGGKAAAGGVEAESCLQGNLCRCTGYRPIYKAVQEILAGPSLVDDDSDKHTVEMESISRRFCAADGAALWLNCSELSDVFTALAAYAGRPFRLVVGNTSTGVLKYYPPHVNDKPVVYINIANVASLRNISSDASSVTFGAAVTLSEVITRLELLSAEVPGFQSIVDHLKLVAHPQVRDVASWTGNVIMAKTHKDFPSDVALLLTLLKAVVTIRDGSTLTSSCVSVEDFLSGDDLKPSQIITEVKVPFPSKDDVVDSFKVMRRHMNTHAEVNAGFHFNFAGPSSTTITGLRAIYGNISIGPLVCVKTAAAVVGKQLSEETLNIALASLATELVVEDPTVPDPPFAVAPPAYRRSLASSLFYKAWLRAMVSRLGEDSVDARLRSAAVGFSRPMSTGSQNYEVDPTDAPIHQAVMKVEAPQQAAGEVQYTADMPWPAHACVAVAVLAKQVAMLTSIDASVALKMEGVVGFVSAETVKKIGANNAVHGTAYPVFAAGATKYVGQIVGLVCASTYAAAAAAADAVVVSYGSPVPLDLTVEDARASGNVHPNEPIIFPLATVLTSGSTVTGELKTTGQKHFYMEPQTTFAVPDSSGGLVVNTATQQLGGNSGLPGCAGTQKVLSDTLNLTSSKIVVQCGAVGGAYGGKVYLYAPVCVAACVAALGLKRPVLLQLDRNADMGALGGRPPCDAKWTVSFDNSSKKITSLDQEVTADAGFDKSGVALDQTSANCYDIGYFSGKFSTEKAVTAKALNTIMRAPGEFQGALFMEAVVEQVARTLQVEPWQVQEANLTDGPKAVWNSMKASAKYSDKRADADAYNADNRWRKRGVYMMATDYHLMSSETYSGYYEKCLVRVEADGVVTLDHSGIEMGQGITTKAAQAATAALRAVAADFDMGIVRQLPKSTSTFSWSAVTPTFGSATSEAITMATLNACTALAEKLSKYKGKTWKDVVTAALADGVDMTATGDHSRFSGNFGYHIYVAACVSAEIDVLTGETQILSADIVYDAGKALNPAVDIGQIEGCFVQALGFCLTEQQVFSSTNGRLVNNGTWDYKVPSAQDIPIEMNVVLLPGTNTAWGNVKGSKASGEPAYCIGSVSYFAVKDAIYAARKDAGDSSYFQLDCPASPESIQQACLVKL